MNVTNQTVLITGGGSGIGLAITKLLAAKGNRVIITGRNEARLQQAAAPLPGVTAIACDITDEASVTKLVQRMQGEFGELSILINNAGQASVYEVGIGADAVSKARAEMDTNYLSLIRLTEALLPLLGQQPEAAVVNVSSLLAYAPAAAVPTYSASKAAVHFYTQALRYSLAKTLPQVRVFELMPPLVNTEFSEGIGGAAGIPPQEVAEALVVGFEQETDEIRVANTADFYEFHRASPAEAFAMLNP
jgi:uncharacterized oxidoreductase